MARRASELYRRELPCVFAMNEIVTHCWFFRYGDMDITGDGGMEFFSNRVKISSKWPLKRKASAISTNGHKDAANFAGSM